MSHVGRNWVGKMDVKDFFRSVTYGSFVSHACTKKASSGEIERLVEINFCTDQKGVRRLPMGSPASPFLSNAYLYRFDWTMAWAGYRYKANYSRYADDIIMSAGSLGVMRTLFALAEKLLSGYGLDVNDDKTRFMQRTGRQVVCGVVVNEKVNLPRKFRKNLRAEVFQQKGMQLSEETKGRLSYANMIINNRKDTCPSSGMIDSIRVSQRIMKGV